MGGGVRKAGFKDGGGVATYVNSAVALKGLRGVENAVVAVVESCLLDVKCGTPLIIS